MVRDSHSHNNPLDMSRFEMKHIVTQSPIHKG
ncbi:unnamed protein product [Brugia timori]|uniref:Transposase n=1 Tax=Brugia timori TaxID=42155 RepID=A0A0R3R8A1_9BILA|nr:unnamed protein product [Brugia timori]